MTPCNFPSDTCFQFQSNYACLRWSQLEITKEKKKKKSRIGINNASTNRHQKKNTRFMFILMTITELERCGAF